MSLRKIFTVTTLKVTNLFLCWWSCSESQENRGEKCLQCPWRVKRNSLFLCAHVYKRKKPEFNASKPCKTQTFRLYLQSPHEMTWPLSVLTFPPVLSHFGFKKKIKVIFSSFCHAILCAYLFCGRRSRIHPRLWGKRRTQSNTNKTPMGTFLFYTFNSCASLLGYRESFIY